VSSERTISPVARNAAQLLGAEIRAGRMDRGWTAADLAERAEVSRPTIAKLERGHPGVALGTALDCASLVGVTLFYDDERRLAAEATDRAALIGRRVRPARPAEVDLDF
jgi:transcriptional regulator with XRE-family HTH domain